MPWQHGGYALSVLGGGWWGFHESQHKDVSPATLFVLLDFCIYVKGSYDACHVILSV